MCSYSCLTLTLSQATASVFGGSVARPEDGSGDADAEQDAKNMADDLEVAWEMLEVARVIYSRFPDDLAVEKELARVYMRLGDLGMESDVFEQAKSDYEKSLMLRQKILKQTQDPDTTLLADLYCCLAISCIYQESTAAGESGENATARQDAIRKHEDEGLKYYVLAGRVMAENIHRVAKTCCDALQAFVTARIPAYASSSSEDAPKGKGKQKATVAKQELLYTADGMDTMRDAFLACVQVTKALASSDAAAVTESLSTNEAQLLEYMEIYVELKEKVDGIIESAEAVAVSDSTSAGVKRSADALDDASEPVTTIGFGDASAASSTTVGFGASADATAAPVNVITVKKRKVTPTTTEAPATAAADAAAQ